MKSIFFLAIIALFITKITNQEIDSGTGVGAPRRPVNVKQKEWVSLNLNEEDVKAKPILTDTLSTEIQHSNQQ